MPGDGGGGEGEVAEVEEGGGGAVAEDGDGSDRHALSSLRPRGRRKIEEGSLDKHRLELPATQERGGGANVGFHRSIYVLVSARVPSACPPVSLQLAL